MATQIRLEGFVGWSVTNRELMRQLPKDKATPIHVFVDSPGGDAFEGFAIFNTLSKRRNVTVEIGARALSAASYIPFAADKVVVSKVSTWMAHNAQSFAFGDKEEMRKALSVLEGIDGIIADIYNGQVEGMSRKEILAKMGEEFWLFGGQSIIDAGIATEMLEAGEEKPGEEESETVDPSEMVENFKVLFSAQMSEKPTQPLDIKCMNLIVEEFKEREGTLVKDANGNEITVLGANTLANIPAKAPTVLVVDTVVAETLPVSIGQIDNSAAINEAVNEAVNNERTRILDLLGMTGVKITDAAKKAIENSVSKGDFAIAILNEQQAQAPSANGERIQAMPAKGMPQMADAVEDSHKTRNQKAADHGDKLGEIWWPATKK